MRRYTELETKFGEANARLSVLEKELKLKNMDYDLINQDLNNRLEEIGYNF